MCAFNCFELKILSFQYLKCSDQLNRATIPAMAVKMVDLILQLSVLKHKPNPVEISIQYRQLILSKRNLTTFHSAIYMQSTKFKKTPRCITARKCGAMFAISLLSKIRFYLKKSGYHKPKRAEFAPQCQYKLQNCNSDLDMISIFVIKN